MRIKSAGPAGNRLCYVLAIILVGGSAVASLRADETWQAHVKNAQPGQLPALVLRVDAGKTLEISAAGATSDAGWGRLNGTDIPFGSLHPSGATAPTNVEQSHDWSGGKATAEFPGGEKLTVFASQLSPGIAVETTGKGLVLFGGPQNHMATFEGGKLSLNSLVHSNRPPMKPITPGYIAVPSGESATVSTVDTAKSLPPADQAWALIWWGRKSHFARSTIPIAEGTPQGSGYHSDAYHADCPMLVVFDQPPSSIGVDPEGGLALAFSGAGRRIAIVPLLGAALPSAEATQKWAEKLPDEIVARCRRLAAYSRQYPLSARESFTYDAAKDEATFSEKVNFLEIGGGGMRLAPMPPLAALAMKEGLDVRLNGTMAELGIATDFGPVVGVADSDTCSWTVKGLGKCLQPRRPAASAQAAPKPLEEQLSRQVAAMLDAGRLAPWTYVDHLPFGHQRGDYYFGEPGEVLMLLSEIYPVLSREQQRRLVEYMTEYVREYPPESRPLIAPDDGARRGGYDHGPCRVSLLATAERSGRVNLFALYGLSRYSALASKAPSKESWEQCRKVLSDAFQGQAWSTLYLLGQPTRVAADRKQITEHRGDRPAAVVNANRTFAGAIGAVRLARQAGDSATEQQAWWMLARSAVLRHAMGKYAGWRYRAGLASFPKKPDWFWANNAGTWHGCLETNNWASPADDVRQVIELTTDRVILADSASSIGSEPFTVELVAFHSMTPELAQFLRDTLKPECDTLVERIAWNQPNWYASFAEAILGAEHSTSHPAEAHQVFLARAQILDATPDQLARWIDVPWVERGDLFYMHKLAGTIKAYRAAK